MFISLLKDEGLEKYKDAVDSVKKAYQTGEFCFTNGKVVKLPHGEQFAKLANDKTKLANDINKGDFNVNHMVNVVCAMAHIIKYIEKGGMESILIKVHGELLPNRSRVSFERKLDNLLIAFYHDVGKTTIDRRHCMEGKTLFAEPRFTMKQRFEELFREFAKDWNANNQIPIIIPEIKLEYYAEMIGAHDIFGTISTGENGLLSLSHVIDRFSDVLDNGEHSTLIEKTKIAIFDLWLLNLADILVSLEDKGKPQDCTLTEPGKNCDLINNLVNLLGAVTEGLDLEYKGKYLKYDLEQALNIAMEKTDRYIYAKNLSEKNAANRFLRLAQQSLGDMLKDVDKLRKKETYPGEYFPGKEFEDSDNVLKDLDIKGNPSKWETVMTEDFERLKEQILNKLRDPQLIVKIKSILQCEFGDDYGEQFGTMLQFDYALGFFRTLAQQAILWLIKECALPDSRTGWMYHKPGKPYGTYEDIDIKDNDKKDIARKDIDTFNAECVVNNYMMVLSGIFGDIRRIISNIIDWNIEFEDARNRLNADKTKAERLLFLSGPYRESSVRHLLMQQIMLYKA